MAITTEGELMDKIVTLCKRRGFVFQSSEIYGGFNGFWDYGPYGTAMKKAIEQLWWSEMVEKRDDVVGLDSTVICHPKVWKASGHIDRFGDIMCDCKHCKARHRVDQMPDPKVCPNCGSNVVEREKGWFCESNPCRFVLWKDNAFFKRLGKRLDSHVADKLLRDGRVRLKDCKSAKGKTYNATVLLSCEADGRSKFSLEFEGGC